MKGGGCQVNTQGSVHWCQNFPWEPFGSPGMNHLPKPFSHPKLGETPFPAPQGRLRLGTCQEVTIRGQAGAEGGHSSGLQPGARSSEWLSQARLSGDLARGRQ